MHPLNYNALYLLRHPGPQIDCYVHQGKSPNMMVVRNVGYRCVFRVCFRQVEYVTLEQKPSNDIRKEDWIVGGSLPDTSLDLFFCSSVFLPTLFHCPRLVISTQSLFRS